jgi:hypothetical protein
LLKKPSKPYKIGPSNGPIVDPFAIQGPNC